MGHIGAMVKDDAKPSERHLECQEALNDRLFVLMEAGVAEGWTEKQVAEAVQELTLAWRRWRREKRATDAQVAAAARMRRQ